MAAYRVEIQRSAESDLSRLGSVLVGRLRTALESLASDPRPPGSRKLAGSEAYRLRVGDYRIVYEVDDRRQIVTVARVRHRRDVYRRLR